MKGLTPVLILLLLVGYANSINMFNLQYLNKTNGAMCMDGSKAAVYTYEPDPNDVTPENKLLIFFEQIWEGWCPREDLTTSISHCQKYVTDQNFIDFGSSNNYPSSQFFMIGILALDSIFAGWTKVIIKSCDGGAYFGDSSVKIKNYTLNFRGSKNVIEAVNYMNKINYLKDRQEVMLVGVGNGGLAAVAWADYIKGFTKGKVRVLPDAGIWENDINDKTKDNFFEKRMKTMNKLFINNGNFPNTKCQQANKGNLQKCFYNSQLVKYVDPSIDVFFLQSYYDGWALTQILGLDCTEQFASLSECTPEHRQAIQNYHKRISDNMHQMVQLPNVRAFGISCVAHFFTHGRWDDEDFSVPMQKNNTSVNIVTDWMTNKPKKIFLDENPWPSNTPCSRKVVMKQNLISQ